MNKPLLPAKGRNAFRGLKGRRFLFGNAVKNVGNFLTSMGNNIRGVIKDAGSNIGNNLRDVIKDAGNNIEGNLRGVIKEAGKFVDRIRDWDRSRTESSGEDSFEGNEGGSSEEKSNGGSSSSKTSESLESEYGEDEDESNEVKGDKDSYYGNSYEGEGEGSGDHVSYQGSDEEGDNTEGSGEDIGVGVTPVFTNSSIEKP